MENTSQPTENNLFDLSVNQESKYHLGETAKWTRFLAIAGFIFIGIMILYGIFISSLIDSSFKNYPPGFESAFPTTVFRTVMITYMVIFGLIYFFPCLFTLRFSNHVKAAIAANDPVRLAIAFKNLKKTARYLGILTIIALVIIGIGAIVFIITFPSLSDFQTPS
jgi:hypothetical protein